jgi:outer membrane protein
MVRTRLGRWVGVTALIALGFADAAAQRLAADTLLGALGQAYQSNPQLNSQRAILRQTDENVPQALSGYRPQISVTASAGEAYSFQRFSSTGGGNKISGWTNPVSIGVTGTQTLFNGFQTANRTRAAESQVSGAREALRVLEQQVMLDGVTAYMNTLRDTALLELQRRNVEVLQEQVRQTRDRFNVGEVTRTDVAQAESRLAAAESSMLGAQSALATSRAAYRRTIGSEPGALSPGMPVDRLSPRSLAASVDAGLTFNPQVNAAMYGIDVALLQVKINEGALYPRLTAQIAVQQQYDASLTVSQTFGASGTLNLTVPVYQGGGEYALIRQSKESLAQRRLDLETTRDQVRAIVVQAWSQLEATKAQIQAAQAQVNAAEVALNGVREEARVGQRTTLDVLNAQQELVNARASLVTAQRDRVVASFTLLSAVGRLSPQVLGLAVPIYDPMVHYQQVRDSWLGVRTPDGR